LRKVKLPVKTLLLNMLCLCYHYPEAAWKPRLSCSTKITTLLPKR
jgi:hypothetical protein